MTTLPPSDAPAVFWIDANGQQQGPEPLTTVIERIAYNQIPASTPVWWQGAANWTTFDTVPEFASALHTRLNPAPAPAPYVEAAPVVEAAPQAEAFTSPTAFSSDPTIGAAPVAEPEPESAFAAPLESADSTRLFDSSPAQDPAIADEPVSAFAVDSGTAGDLGSEVIAAELDDTVPVAAEIIEDAPAGSAFAAPTLAPITLDPIELVDTASADSPDVITPFAEPTAGDDLDALFADLVSRAQPFVDEQTKVAGLNDTVSSLIRSAAESLGHRVNSHEETNGYHMFSLSDSNGSPFSLAVTQIPYADTVDEAIARPVGVHVDRGGRASVHLFLGDYLGGGDEAEALFAHHLSAIIHAAGR